MGVSRIFFLFLLIVSPFGVSGQILYFDTGIPSNPYPSIWGTHTATFTPAHDMLLSSGIGTNCTGTAGNVMSVEFYENGILIGSGTGGGWKNPFIFSTPLRLYAGVAYALTVKTGSYPQLFHDSAMTNADATISNIQFVDANGEQRIAFPVLWLYGPALPPQTNGPTLKVFRSEANPTAILVWPTNDAGFTLQCATNLSQPIVWSTNLPAPVIISGQYRVTDALAVPQKFYRLRKP